MFTTLAFSAEELFDTPGRLGLISQVNNGLVGVLERAVTVFDFIARDTQARNGLYLDVIVSYSNDPVPAIAAPFEMHVFPARGTAQGLDKALAYQADNPGRFYSPVGAVFSDSVGGSNGLPYLIWMVSSADIDAQRNWSVAAALLAGDASGPVQANTVVAIQNKDVPAPAVGGTRLVFDLTTDALVWYSTPVYDSLAAAAAGQANQILGERVVIYSDPATSETGTYVVNALTGDPGDYMKKSDATDTAAEVAVVDAGGYYPGAPDVESALQLAGSNNLTLREDGLALGGFIEPESTVVASFADLSRTLTIGPVGASYAFYSNGQYYIKAAAESIAIADSEGTHYVYYDGDGVLQATQAFSLDIITRYAIVAIIRWDAVNKNQIYFGREYRHTTWMGGLTHARLHSTVGYALESGGLLADFTIGNGSLDAHAQFSNAASVAWDEDARFELAARLISGDLPVYYRLGEDALNIWRVLEGGAQASFPVRTGGGRAYFNELVGTTWQLTEVTNNDFVIAFVALSNDTDRPFSVFMGQAEYPTAVAARDAVDGAINDLIVSGLPVEEFNFVGAVILQTSDSYANTVKSRVIEIETDVPYLDLRGSVIGRLGTNSTVGDHNILAGLQGGQPGEYYHLTATQHDQLVNAETVTMDLTDASENVIATIPDISSITTVEWAVTLYDPVTPRATRYNIMASHVDGVSLLTVSGLGPDYGEIFDIEIIAGPPNDLVLRVTPDGANWNAIVTRTVVHRA